MFLVSELQVKGGIAILSLFLNDTVCCDHSLEPSRRDGFNEWSEHKV